MVNYDRSELREGLDHLDHSDLEEIKNLMEDGVEPESDDEVMIGMMFTREGGDHCHEGERVPIRSEWKEQFSFALGLLVECELAVKKELEEREDSLRELEQYKKAMTFLEVLVGSTLYPDWENAAGLLEDHGGFDDEVITLAIADAKVASDPESDESF